MRAASIVALIALAGCSGEAQPVGLDEPLFVRNGVFQRGDLPGAAPSDAGATVVPGITAVESANNVISAAQGGKSYAGRTTPEAWSVGVRLDSLGTGWWMIPVGGADPSYNNELTWQLTADFGGAITPGLHRLRFVALDAQGRGGTQRDARVCVLPAVPDNLNACDATLAPPDAVLSLTWDTDADLDLVVVTPEGKIVDARHPTTAPVTGTAVDAAALRDPSTGALDRNSNAGCAIDHIRRENLVWQGAPAPGTYRVYASLFDACRQSAARFRVTLTRRADGAAPGTHRPIETVRRDGIVTALAARGGATLGTFVTEVTLP